MSKIQCQTENCFSLGKMSIKNNFSLKKIGELKREREREKRKLDICEEDGKYGDSVRFQSRNLDAQSESERTADTNMQRRKF